MGMEQSIDAGAQGSVKEKESNEGGAPSVLVVCGPSGVGKGTLIDLLTEESDGFGFSVSHTTREPREGEKNGVQYHFITKAEFEKGISEGQFLEYAQVHENFYGSSKDAVNAVLNSGKCCILDIDVQGARQVRESGIKAVFVFVAPPSDEELEKRLKGRGTDSPDQIDIRLRTARTEMESLRETGLFDFCIVNGDLSEAYAQMKAIAMKAKAGQMPEAQEIDAVSHMSGISPRSKPRTADEFVEDAENGIARRPSSPIEMPKVGMAKWKGKVALITGASSGVGWATCEALALAGMRVVAVARVRERLEGLQQAVMAKGVPAKDFLPVVCDTTKEGEVVALPRIVAKRWPETPGIDVLINNAGLNRGDASLMNGNTATWVEMVSTNVLGVCMCAREIIQSMKQRNEWGHIINISSSERFENSEASGGGNGFYCATQQAVKALSEGLRSEARGMGAPLRVSCISPGAVHSEASTPKASSDSRDPMSILSQRKSLDPDDIAQSILWILSAPEHMEINNILMGSTHS
ncbi:hypothetical protein BSKO_12919 [Bryopsis sp. KO-2023]|nr:hypothetical protein BSKO_12919 [Bryopsis sp. KO-2023]